MKQCRSGESGDCEDLCGDVIAAFSKVIVQNNTGLDEPVLLALSGRPRGTRGGRDVGGLRYVFAFGIVAAVGSLQLMAMLIRCSRAQHGYMGRETAT